MVTGGYHDAGGDGNGGLASTELLREHAWATGWVYAGSLPSARYRSAGATLGGKLIMTGQLMVMMVYKYLRYI